jgi:hypothetical protein
LLADRIAGRHMHFMQTGYLAVTWFACRQGCLQAHALHPDRVAGRHMVCRKTGLLAGTCTACRQGCRQAFRQQADRQVVTKACGLAGKDSGRQ